MDMEEIGSRRRRSAVEMRMQELTWGPSYSEWLAQEGAVDSHVSQAIYSRVFPHAKFFRAAFSDAEEVDYRSLFSQGSRLLTSPSAEFLQQLRDWRTSTQRRDVLQTVVKTTKVVEQNCTLARTLVACRLFSANDYRGSSGYVNHPAHMALFVWGLAKLRELLPLLPCTQPDNWTVNMFTDEGRPVYSASTYHLHCPKPHLVLLYSHYYNVFASQDPHQLTKSSIEFVWDLLRKIRHNLNWAFHNDILRTLFSEKCGFHVAIPFLQLVSVVKWDDNPTSSAFCVLQHLHILSDNQVCFFLKWMRNDQLHLVRKAALNHVGCGQVPRCPKWEIDRRRSEAIIDMVEEERQNRTLQQHCMLTILQSVGGVSADVMALPIPGPLKTHFRIPFQTEYEQLCLASQQNQNQQLQQN